MKKSYLPYIIFLLLVFILAILVEQNQPKKIDWKESYTGYDKVPYGCYIVKQVLQEAFPHTTIVTSKDPIYTTFKKSPKQPINYILVNNRMSIDETETDKLLQLVENGSNVFISAYEIYGALADTLHFQTDINWNDSSTYVNYVNPSIKFHKPFHFSKLRTLAFFNSIDTTNTIVLGTCLNQDQQEQINFIKITKGKGAFYINTFPEAFTNYSLLEEKAIPYVAGLLSYLPDYDIYWDEYYKVGKRIVSSPLRYILSQEALKWAYYVFIFSVLFFLFFKAKRTQRIIPIVTPLRNTTVDFVQTIGKLYFEKHDHKDIAEKKITYFFDYIRTEYREKNIVFTKQFYQTMAEKSAIALDEVEKLFAYIENVRKSNSISDQQLNTLNYLIEKFHQKTLR